MLKLYLDRGGIVLVDKVNVSLRNRSFYMNYSRGYENSRDMEHFHLHQDYEIFYLFEGEKIFLINGMELVAKKETLLFINKNVLHKTIANDHNYQRIVINFRDSFILEEDQHLISILFKQGPLMLSLNNQPSFSFLLDKMLTEYHINYSNSNRYLQLLLSQFLLECERLLHQQKPLQKDSTRVYHQHEIVDDIISHINENYYKSLTLTILAEIFYLHEQYVSKLFKQSIGCSFTEYLNAVRITEAKRLLSETNLKINQITKRVGYTNHVHLWRIFKKLTGISPNEYREQQATKCKRYTTGL